MVLTEHFSYLSDQVRLDRFREAVGCLVRPGDLVVDLGCGVGVLGLLCLESGAAHCWGIDQTDAIEIARQTMTKSGLSDRYTCIRDRSFLAELPQSVDLIICDHVGYFGIDYGIIDMVADAKRRFLKPGGTIIPTRIKLYLAAASSAECREKAEAWSSETIPAAYRWLRSYGVNTKQAHAFRPEDLYTRPAELATIDLGAENPDNFSFNASLSVTRDGAIDGLVGWFDCKLAKDVWMTNSPEDPRSIDREQAFLPFDQPVAVKAGYVIEARVTIRHDTGMIAWAIDVPATGQRQRGSNWQSLIIPKSRLNDENGSAAQLNRTGAARKVILEYTDGKRSVSEIARAVHRDFPHLFSSVDAALRLAQHELARSIQ